jgi:hypothetical protein
MMRKGITIFSQKKVLDNPPEQFRKGDHNFYKERTGRGHLN